LSDPARLRRLLWIGPISGEESALRDPNISLAANRWQRGLLAALEGEGMSVFVAAAVPARVFPKGPARMTGGEISVASSVNGRAVSYWNIPGLREKSAGRQIVRAVERWGRPGGRIDAVLSYNLAPRNVLAARELRKREGIPWIAVVADRSPGEESLLRSRDKPDGCIFLSWWRYVSSDFGHKIHLDGGVDPEELAAARDCWRARPDPIVMYSGSGSRFGGLSALLDAFQRVSLAGAKLWVTGDKPPGNGGRSDADAERVVHLGRLPRVALLERWRQASVFVDPRPASLSESRDNFPSKILDYLMTGLPVLSTMTAGLSPEYADLLRPLEGADPDEWAKAVTKALLLDERTRRRSAERAWAFLTNGRTWPVQARRLARWLRNGVPR
jgi:glycosyltransferase involved in cell wall biosynthesis